MTDLRFWGVIASPFQLKMQSLADFAGIGWQRWPDQAGRVEAFICLRRLRRALRLQAVQRYPLRDPALDEYPAVPFYSFDGHRFYYDSTGLALHLDANGVYPHPLLPSEPELRFVCRLIDEAFDEFGLYMVHHNRWVTSAATNTMGEMTAREMRQLLPPLMAPLLARKLARRQVARCPYLFSVAPEGYDNGLASELTPPSRRDFPATHALLDTAWRGYLEAMEHVLTSQPFLLGERFTLADASAYGQLGMNLVDGRAAELLQEIAPRTFQWLGEIRDGAHKEGQGLLQLADTLTPLVEIIGKTFIPLMRQNEQAYCRYLEKGQRTFNEAAFDRHEALYDGELMGRPFRAVAKTFQVVVWRELCADWRTLTEAQRSSLQARYQALSDSAFCLASPD